MKGTIFARNRAELLYCMTDKVTKYTDWHYRLFNQLDVYIGKKRTSIICLKSRKKWSMSTHKVKLELFILDYVGKYDIEL